MDKSASKLKGFFGKKSFKYGSYSLITIAVVIAITIVINLLVGMAGIKVDLTSSGLYSLTSETNKVVDAAKNKQVTIYGLFDDTKFTNADDYGKVAEILKRYSKYSNVKVEFVDLDKNPSFVNSIDPDNQQKMQAGDVVVMSGKKLRTVASGDLVQSQQDQSTGQVTGTQNNVEQSITGAIKYVTSAVSPTVYFITGHGERSVDTDYTIVKQYLQRNNYDVKTINLMSEPSVPKDAATLVVASPQSDLSVNEMGKIKAYLDNAGKAVFMFDALKSGVELTNFENILSSFNIGLNNDMVKENDDDRHVPGQVYDILPDIQQNDINAPLGSDFLMIMPASRSLKELKNSTDTLDVFPLMTSSSKAEGVQINTSKGANNQGPLDLAIASQQKGLNGSKVLAIGNGSFITDSAVSQYQQYSINGLYFFINSLNWMQDKKDDTVIQPKVYDSQTILVSQSTGNAINILLMVVLPLLIIAAGMVVWVRRRHL
ncbi:MAG: GldG family protein [Bacillota bacterium]|nr:GldG family protein [Bacillota bacterium]